MTNTPPQMTEPSELKPCPFCGCEARWVGAYFYEQNSTGEHVFCNACGAKMPRYWPKRTAGAKGAWNTRAAIAAMQPALPDVALLKGTTPGPWEIDMSYQSPSYIRAANGVLVASACWAIGDDRQTIANALLIAAAPDLARENARKDAELATLRAECERMRKALAYAIEKYGKPGGPWNVPSDPGGWLDLARAALAATKGIATVGGDK